MLHFRGTTEDLLVRLLFLIIWLLAGLHIAAEYYYLYWTYWWFDVLTHFIGGLWLGIASIWLYYFSGYVRTMRPSLRQAFATALMAGLVVGIAWEVYEYVVWQLSGEGLPGNYVSDTLSDIMMDSIGAAAGFIVYRYVVGTTPSGVVPAIKQ
jgi:hypothetical protein